MTPMQELHADLASVAEYHAFGSHPAERIGDEVIIFCDMSREIEKHANERLDLLSVRIAYLSAQKRRWIPSQPGECIDEIGWCDYCQVAHTR